MNYKNSLNSAVYSRWYVAVAGIIAILMLAFAATPKARAASWPQVMNINTVYCTTAEDAVSILQADKDNGYEAAHVVAMELASKDACFQGGIVVAVVDELATFVNIAYGPHTVNGYVLEGETPEGKTFYFIVLRSLEVENET